MKRRAQTRRFIFNTVEEISCFIKLYGDLFIPYAESTINSAAHTIDDMISMHNGYIIGRDRYWFKDDSVLEVNVFVEPEGFKEILSSNLFDKIPLEPKASRQYCYQLKES